MNVYIIQSGEFKLIRKEILGHGKWGIFDKGVTDIIGCHAGRLRK